MLKILLLWLSGGIWCLSNMILRPKRISCDSVYRMEAKKKKFDEELYKNTNKKKFMLLSDFGYNLSCELLEPSFKDINSKREKSIAASNPHISEHGIAILCHGFSHGKYKSLKYAEIFLKLGFRVIIYDHRNHGLSGKAFTSMGYYEKYDLKKIVDWCDQNYPDCKIVTHGESMGAATALLHLGIDNRVVCTIADCAYSDLKDLLKHQLKAYYHMPLFLIPIESFITYIRAGFWYGQVSPIRVVSKVDTPILFIHGKRDAYVPTDMSRKMYACKRNKKALYLMAGAGHAQCISKNKLAYEKCIEKFLIKYV